MKPRFSNTFDIQEPGEVKHETLLAEGITLFIIALTLVLFGLVILYSISLGIKNASTYFFLRQVQWCVIGFIAMFAVIAIGYKKLSFFMIHSPDNSLSCPTGKIPGTIVNAGCRIISKASEVFDPSKKPDDEVQ